MELLLDKDDMLTEIFLRLPAKSLTRFKSVCKKWLSHISSDYFCHLHTLRLPKLQLSLILQTHSCEFFYWKPTTNGEKKMIPYSLSVAVSDYEVVHACNGLMLLKFKQHDEPLKSGYYVYNPTTKRSRMITLTHNDEYPDVAGMYVAFDPSNSPYYKIVCVKIPADSRPIVHSFKSTYRIEVYDSESRTWKLGLYFKDPACCPVFFGTYWNSAIYWKIPEEDGYIYFDIDKNEKKTLSVPRLSISITSYVRSRRLLGLNGHLYYIECHETIIDWKVVSRQVGILELDLHSHEWLWKHSVDLTSTAETSYFVAVVGLIGGSGSDGDGIYGMLIIVYLTKVTMTSQTNHFTDQIFAGGFFPNAISLEKL